MKITLNTELSKINETLKVLHNLIMNETDSLFIRSAQKMMVIQIDKRDKVEAKILKLRNN